MHGHREDLGHRKVSTKSEKSSDHAAVADTYTRVDPPGKKSPTPRTYPGAMDRAVLRRPRRARRGLAMRRVTAKLPQIGVQPSHMYDKIRTSYRVSIWVTPRSSNCATHTYKTTKGRKAEEE